MPTITRFSALLRPGLRLRFLAAMFALVLVLLAGFVYAVSGFLDVLEDDMMYGQLQRQLNELNELYQDNGELPPLHDPGLKAFVVPRGQTAELPAAVADLAAGETREIRLPNAPYEYAATRRDLGDVSLYVVLDLTPVERLEEEFISVAWVAGLTALVLAVLLALWLSHMVMRPVKSLSARVAHIVPGQSRPELKAVTSDRELGVIAETLDNVLDRFDDFVAREQAFTEDASHELRTPLATVMSSLDLLDDDASLSPKARRRMARAQAAAGRMHELIEALLLMSRDDCREESATAVAPIVCEAVSMLEYSQSGRGARHARIVVETLADYQVNAPGSMLLSVVNNLLHNAVSHGEPSRIDVTLDGAHLRIRDHGRGIPPAVMTRLFDRRFHGDHSRGYGLGLYIVKRICDRYGWSIDAHSTSGEGTRFDLYFAGGRAA